jgi:hypothetical protein
MWRWETEKIMEKGILPLWASSIVDDLGQATIRCCTVSCHLQKGLRPHHLRDSPYWETVWRVGADLLPPLWSLALPSSTPFTPVSGNYGVCFPLHLMLRMKQSGYRLVAAGSMQHPEPFFTSTESANQKGGGCPSYQIIWQCTYASHNRQCGNREGAVLWTERMCPPEFVCWRLTSNRTVFEGGCFGSVLVKRVRGLVFGTSTIIGGTDAMIPPQGGHEENLKMLTREMDLPRHQGSQYSNLWGPRKVRNQCLLSSLHSCCILFSTPPNYMARGGYFQAWKICQSQDDVCQLQVYVCQSQDDVCQSQDDISSSLRKKNFRKGGHEGSQALPWKPIKDASEGSCL